VSSKSSTLLIYRGSISILVQQDICIHTLNISARHFLTCPTSPGESLGTVRMGRFSGVLSPEVERYVYQIQVFQRNGTQVKELVTTFRTVSRNPSDPDVPEECAICYGSSGESAEDLHQIENKDCAHRFGDRCFLKNE
jgi:hypothetical protein